MKSPMTAATGASETAPNGWPWPLLRGFREGEPAALREVYQRHADEVSRQLRFGFSFDSRGRAHRFVGYGSAFELHDALHETFVRAFEPRARQGYDGLRPYGPYLKAIARNVVLRTFRQREVSFPVLDEEGQPPSPLSIVADESGPSPETAVARTQVAGVVREFLDALQPEERRLLQVRFIDGKSQRDAAEILGLGRQQIRSREAKLRKRLVQHLAKRGEAGLLPSVLCLPLTAMTMAQWIAEAWR